MGAHHDCGDANGRQHRQSVPDAIRDIQLILIAGHQVIASDIPRRKLVFDVQVGGLLRVDGAGRLSTPRFSAASSAVPTTHQAVRSRGRLAFEDAQGAPIATGVRRWLLHLSSGIPGKTAAGASG
jgi:hypothetical protein